MRIYLVRHGQNEDNARGILNGHRDLPLTTLGISQAQETGNKIKEMGLQFDVVLSSPLVRAYRTAQIISECSNNPEPLILHSLIERDFGIMSGKRACDIEKMCGSEVIRTDTVTYFISPVGAESFDDSVRRAKRVLSYLQSTYEHRDILLVSHGDFGKMLYAAYYDVPWREVLTQFHFGNSEILLLSRDSTAEDAHIFHLKQYNH